MISVCIIVKNDKSNMEHCVSCLCDHDFEINVVDTGSTDGTLEWLQEKEQEGILRLFHFEWINDFAAAKNYAVSKATNETVLVLDSDEYLKPLDKKAYNRLESAIKKHPGQIGRIKRINTFSDKNEKKVNVEWINRLFPKSQYHYEGRIHEQLVRLDGKPFESFLTDLSADHSGYDLSEKELKEKAARNITMLQLELKELEDSKNSSDESMYLQKMPYVLFQLGKSYYMAEDYASAASYFAEGLTFDLNPKLEYVIDMVETYGYALINSGQAEVALGLEGVYNEFGDSADFKFLMGCVYMNNALFENAIQEFEQATAYKECRIVGVNSYSAYYNIGVIYEVSGNVDKAKDYYKKCGKYEPARKRLRVL